MKKCVVSQLELFSEVPGFDKRIRKQIFAMHRVLKCIPYLNSPFDAFFFSCTYLSFKIQKIQKVSFYTHFSLIFTSQKKSRFFFLVSQKLFWNPHKWKSVCDNPKSNIDNPTFALLSTTHLLMSRTSGHYGKNRSLSKVGTETSNPSSLF